MGHTQAGLLQEVNQGEQKELEDVSIEVHSSC